MTSSILPVLANLGAGSLLATVALLLLSRISAPRFTHEPASSHRVLLLSLVLASLLLLVPWLRLSNGARATPTAMDAAIQTAGAMPTTGGAGEFGYYVLCALGAAWLAGAALAASLSVISVVQLASILGRACPAPSRVEDVRARCPSPGAGRFRRILLSDEASVPFAAVPWAPVLVLPSTFLDRFDDAFLQLTIEHETAHLERGDLWTSAAVRALCVLFPFNPAATRLADAIAFAREASVDARVSKRDPHRYATLLVEVAAEARFDQLPRPVSMDDTALRRRIDLLTDSSRRRPLSLVAPGVVAASLAAGGLVAPPVFAMPARLSPPAGVQEAPGREVLRIIPESSYAACDEKTVGDSCSTSDFSDGTCILNPEEQRVFCAPPPPPVSP